MPVSQIQAAINVLNGQPALGASRTDSTAFKDFLSQAIETAELASDDSLAFNDALMMGEVNNLHDVTIASNEAQLSLSLVVQVRDRLVEAYNEIMRMSV